ncbi:MAG TPA: hypothetical protein ENH12_07185 [Proteobacteria bacterium]|nr:hypothetical protein [Pseudomonadota bacterium]
MLKQGVIFILLVLLIAMAVGGYWYIRNYIYTGTPLYPIGLRLGGETIFPGVEIPSQFPPPDTPLTKHWSQFSRVIYSWLDNPSELHMALTEVSHNSGGLGLLWIFGCLPALIWVLVSIIRRKGGRQGGWILPAGTGSAWIGITIIGLVLFFAMPPRHNHKVRYIIWIYGFGLPAFFLAVERIRRSSSVFRRRLGLVWISAVLVLFIGEGIYSFGYQVKKISLSRQGVREGAFHPSHLIRAAWEKYPPGYFLPKLKESLFRRVFQYQEPVAIGELNSFPEQREIVGHLTQGDAFGVRPIYFLDRDTASDPAKLSRFIRDRRIRYIVWNPDIPVPPALGMSALLWDRVPGWYYLLVVDPDGVYPDSRKGGQSP